MDIRKALSHLLPEFRAYARSICFERADAEDLVSDAVERALTARNRPNDLDGIRPWMFRIIRNLNIDAVRKQKVRRDYFDTVSRSLTEDNVSGRVSALEQSTLDDVLTRIAFEKLNSAEREVLYLVDVTGFKYAEAAEVLDVPVGTIMSRVSRARRALLALVDDTNVTELKTGKTAKRRKGRV